jgi:hypothetical protein
VLNSFVQSFEEFIEIFFVQEYFVPIVSIIIKTLSAFSDGQVIIITASGSYIEEISSSFASSDAFTVNAVHSFFVVIVRHS